ncbi:AMP-binding enzyme [Trichostrongylus colubriformis]|uniref:AMP-binding enzyme n=1 Tax=Trichostrongylus colubriformis TaxID=6319 RepID=A0AAN8FWD4_TRICO
MLVALYHGTTQIIMDKFDLKTLLRHIQDYKLTTVAVVPAMALMMADSPLLDDYDLSSLRIIACGAAPLGTAIVNRILKRLPDVILRQGYGMTEVSVASHMATLDTPEGSVGKLMPGTKMKVVAENGRLCGPYESGEMWISGPQVMKGYWKRPEQTKETYDSDGFMRTGDIVYYDKDGFVFICDRQKELIKVNGKQVSPSEIEAVLHTLPGITDCCVIGLPDEKYGEVPVAYVVSKTVTEEQISAFVAERLASYKRLRGGVKFVDQIPRTPTGKLLRRQLKDQHMKAMKPRYQSQL